MNKKKLLLQTKCCDGYGYLVYVETGIDKRVTDMLDNFCMWGGSTKSYENHKAYELPEDTMKFMQTDIFCSFLSKCDAILITDKETEHAVKDLYAEIFNQITV